MTTNPRSAIDKIRAEVEVVRREHSNCAIAVVGSTHLGYCCPTLSWAEKCLRLAEALQMISLGHGTYNRDQLIHAANVIHEAKELAERVLDEVTR